MLHLIVDGNAATHIETGYDKSIFRQFSVASLNNNVVHRFSEVPTATR